MLFFTAKAGRWLVLLGLLLGACPGRAQQLAAGVQYTVSVKADGTMLAWGANNLGQLGVGTTDYATTPQVVAGSWREVSACLHTVALKADNTLWTWGNNTYGQLGNGTSNTAPQLQPRQVGTATWRSVAAGRTFTLAVRTDGTLWAWGYNYSGQLGLGTAGAVTPQASPVQVGTGTTWQSVSAGDSYALALKADGTLWAWGDNSYGTLGLGPAPTQVAPTQVGTATWRTVSAGVYHALAVRQDGTLWAWGRSQYGQLGDGSYLAQNSPVQIGTATTWRRADAGRFHSMAVRQDGTLWAWGRNDAGQLGTGNPTQQPAPVRVGTASNWLLAEAGDNHTAALRQDNSCWVWGHHELGQLGNGQGPQLTPRPAAGTPAWLRVAAGGTHVLAVRPDGSLWSWGDGSSGKTAQAAVWGNYLDSDVPAPVGAAAGPAWTSVAAGVANSAAIRSDGTLWTWGDNTYGQLGVGSGPFFTDVPLQVSPGTTWRSVAVGYYHVLAVRQDGTLWSWGQNGTGQLGQTTGGAPGVPTQVGTASTWQSVSAGPYCGLATRQDGTLWAWGQNNSGQLGLGNNVVQYAPSQVGTATTWAAVAAGGNHTIAVRQDGTLWSWGSNLFGELGDNNPGAPRYSPAQLGTATTWRLPLAGLTHSGALRADGSLWTWGYNYLGQLGHGHAQPLAVPTQVGTASWQQASLGNGYSVGVQADGSLWAWGFNDHGQLGTGTLANATPLYLAAGGAPLATTSPAAPAAWVLAPNPAHAEVQVLGLPAGPVQVHLYDATGRLVRQAGAATVPTAWLAPGLYLLQATAAGVTRTLRLAVE